MRMNDPFDNGTKTTYLNFPVFMNLKLGIPFMK